MKTFFRHHRPSSLDQHTKRKRKSKTEGEQVNPMDDRLIPFKFDIEHLAGDEMGLVDYMSSNPVGLAISPSAYDQNF